MHFVVFKIAGQACLHAQSIFMLALLQDGQGLRNSSCCAFSLNMKSDAIRITECMEERERERGRGREGGRGGTGYDRRESWLQAHSLVVPLKAFKLQKVPRRTSPFVSLSLW